MKRRITHKILRLMVLFLMPLVVCGSSVQQAEELFYYAFDEKVPIEKVPGKFMVKKKPGVSKEEAVAIISSCLEKADFDWFNDDICTVSTDDGTVGVAVRRLLNDDAFLSVRPVYILTEDKEYFQKHDTGTQPLAVGMIDQITLQYKDGVGESVRDSINKLFNLTECSRNEVFELYSTAKDVDILEVSNRLFETGLFVFAYPELVCRVTFCDNPPVYPNDPYFQYQVTLHNTGQSFNGHTGTPDADIDAPEAWALTMGSPDIVIAVIDEGVTYDHPDLPNSRQVRLSGSNFGSGDPNCPSPIGNHNHGNACAGVIAATANNGKGIAGVAPLCSIMPIRTDSTSLPNQIASAIRFAANHGANIISCSWSYRCTRNDFCPDIISAIDTAISRNSLVVFSAGNTARHSAYDSYNGYVEFPANHKINGMLTVGASDRYDMQADYSPTDTCIDVVAPSNRASPYKYGYTYLLTGETSDMWTIDIPGSNGYNPWHTDQGNEFNNGETLPSSGADALSYTGHFGGTSHSCPVVAGVAALVLSVNPQLTPQDVCDVLKASADTVGGYLYGDDRRCDEMGYGRVNANNAVWMVCNTTLFTNNSAFIPVDTTITGCDVYMKEDTLGDQSILRVRARNTVTIEKDFYISQGAILDIKPY